MRLSPDKISHLAHLLIEGPSKAGLFVVENKMRLLNLTKEVLTDYCRADEEVDRIVRKKVSSYGRSIPEGSREWDVMYRKHFDEEMRKLWR